MSLNPALYPAGLVTGVALIDVEQGYELQPYGKAKRRVETEYSVSLQTFTQVPCFCLLLVFCLPLA